MNHSTVSGCGEIEHSENSRKSGQQKNPTARKQLDISIKRTLKFGHRFAGFVRYSKKKLWQHLCHSFLVGAGGFASRGLKNSPQDCFLPSADGRPVRILPAPAQKRTRNLSCGSFLSLRYKKVVHSISLSFVHPPAVLTAFFQFSVTD